jgi:hypothetical protein
VPDRGVQRGLGDGDRREGDLQPAPGHALGQFLEGHGDDVGLGDGDVVEDDTAQGIPRRPMCAIS